MNKKWFWLLPNLIIAPILHMRNAYIFYAIGPEWPIEEQIARRTLVSGILIFFIIGFQIFILRYLIKKNSQHIGIKFFIWATFSWTVYMILFRN